MKKGGGKNKGSAFERKVCKELSLWWTEGERDDVFWTTAGSGARRTVRGKCGVDTANSAGDICYLDEEGKPLIDLCVFELKCGYHSALSINKLLDSSAKSEPLLMIFWHKLQVERLSEKNPRPFQFLIYKRDRRTPIIVLSDESLTVLETQTGPYPHDLLSFSVGVWHLYLMRYEEFLDFFPPDVFKSLCEDYVT